MNTINSPSLFMLISLSLATPIKAANDGFGFSANPLDYARSLWRTIRQHAPAEQNAQDDEEKIDPQEDTSDGRRPSAPTPTPEQREQYRQEYEKKLAQRRQELMSLPLPEFNKAQHAALKKAASIRVLTDQEYPGKMLIQHPEWAPLPMVLLKLIKQYSDESDEEITFKRQATLTNNQTWVPKVPSAAHLPLYVIVARSHAAAYQKVNNRQLRHNKMTPYLHPEVSPFFRWGPDGHGTYNVYANPETTFTSLKQEIAQKINIPEDDLELCLQATTNRTGSDGEIVPCNGLEHFIHGINSPANDSIGNSIVYDSPTFKYIVRAYNKNVAYDFEELSIDPYP